MVITCFHGLNIAKPLILLDVQSRVEVADILYELSGTETSEKRMTL